MSVEDLATWLTLVQSVDGDDLEVSAVIRLARSRAEREDDTIVILEDEDFPTLTKDDFESMFGETPQTEARRITKERLMLHFEKTGCVGETFAPISGPLFRAAIDEIVADAA